MGLVSYRLAVCKDSVKKVGSVKWESSIWKGWLDDALHDPPRVQTDLLRVTLLPLEHQGPHDRLT